MPKKFDPKLKAEIISYANSHTPMDAVRKYNVNTQTVYFWMYEQKKGKRDRPVKVYQSKERCPITGWYY